MSHKLLQFTESVYSRPHLISQAGFNVISQYLDDRNKYGLIKMEPAKPSGHPTADMESGIGIINVSGALTYKPVNGVCGDVGCSYEDILTQAEAVINSGAKLLILNCNSGGGEGYGAFETGNELRQMCDAAGVYSIAYNDGCIASACYVLAVQCDEVICNPASETGSIGVLIALMNNSKHLEQEGYTRSFISAGDSKIPFADDGTWKQGFLDDLQTKVDTLYAEFVGYVAKYTGLSEEVIKGTQAKCFMASDALEIGLINKIMTRSEFVDYIVNKQKELT